jgi:hypothetical protein
MTLIELFTQLGSLGLTVQLAGDDLECRGNQSQLTDELRQALKEHRQVFLDNLPKPLMPAETDAALVDLRDWLHQNMPGDYRVSCNETFWQEFDQLTDTAVESNDATAFGQLKEMAEAEFDEFTRLMFRPCSMCGAVPWFACPCDWSIQVLSKNTAHAKGAAKPRRNVVCRPAVTTQENDWWDGDVRLRIPAGESVSILSGDWERYEPDTSARRCMTENLKNNSAMVVVLLRDKVRLMPKSDLREL